MNNSIIVLNDNNFDEEVLKSELPVLVDFWAKWCGPCQGLLPILEKFATENLGKVKIGKLDVDESHQTATKYGVRSIPMLILFKDGKALASKIGVLPQPQLQAFLDSHLT